MPTHARVGQAIPGEGVLVAAKDPSGNTKLVEIDAAGNLKITGTLSTTAAAAGTSVLTNVASSAASVTVLAANANRLAFTLYNDSTQPVNVKFGTTASATSFTKRLLPNDLLTTKDIGVNYTGRIDGIWDAANGSMRVTELTA